MILEDDLVSVEMVEAEVGGLHAWPADVVDSLSRKPGDQPADVGDQLARPQPGKEQDDVLRITHRRKHRTKGRVTWCKPCAWH